MKKLNALIALALVLLTPHAVEAQQQQKPLVLKNGQVQQVQPGTTVAVQPSTTGAASLNIPHGTAPTTPANGDVWTTTGGVYTRVNGVTLGPLFGTGATGTFRSQQYTGTYQTQVNAYGGRILVTTPATDNAIVGAVVQDGSNGYSFPTGATGYGLMVNAGNQAFGLFGQADLGTNGGAAVNGTAVGAEVNCFNYSGAASTSLPPDLSFGTTQKNCIPLQVVSYGNFPSSIGINVGLGSQPMLTGLYFHPQAVTSYAILVDATSANGASYGAILKSKTSGIPLQLQTLGTISNGGAVINVTDNGGTTRAKVSQIGDYYGRAYASSGLSVPTVPTCTGVGTGGTCTLLTGSGDGGGTIRITAGTGASAAGGTISLTFSSAIGTNGSACHLQAGPNFLSNTSLFITAQSATSVTFNYLNGGGTGTAFTNGVTYDVNYWCMGR